jgi:two-component system, response regulator PdtaR
VVEDELFIRMGAVTMIEEAGYNVVEAGNADEAIRILEARTDIRIVFTDIEMPGSMDGLKLARYVRDRWPPIQLVVTSGRHRINDADLPPRGHFVPKPYNSHLLGTVMRRLAS